METATKTATETQVTATHYDHEGVYEGRQRHYSYVEQILQTVALKPDTVLEVGIGSGYVSRALRGMGCELTTIDYAADLNPDIVASVTDIPLADKCVDVSLCFQVLEHLPFSEFPIALRELKRVTRNYLFISIPDCRPYLRMEFSRGWQNETVKRWSMNSRPFWKARQHTFDGQHYWEVGSAYTPESLVLETIASVSLQVERHYRLHLNPYHHFFLLKI